MATIKSLDKISAKWAGVTPSRQAEYADGIQNTTKDWATLTGAANARYKSGVSAAIGKDSFAKGVAAAGTSKWKANSIAKGPGRWAEGVANGANAYAKGFQPYAEAIAATVLPARLEKGNPANINRVAVIAKALNDKKNSLSK
jgi:hypothetical protein